VDWFDLVLQSINHPEEPAINLKNRAIKKAATLIEIAAATEKTLSLYELKGRKEGRLEGQKENSLEIAQKMKAKGFDAETISEMTGLEAETIRQIGVQNFGGVKGVFEL